MASSLNVFSPTICLTHRCNLDCVYCYQTHDSDHEMSLETLCSSLDWIYDNIPKECTRVSIHFMGGEPLLRFDLIQYAFSYVNQKHSNYETHFFATTNGTCLSNSMKEWLVARKDKISLALSIDGQKKIHDLNRSNSFDKIDIPFFLRTWPMQGVKMTLSYASLDSLADDVIFLHDVGFQNINGVNLAEGDFDWSDPLLIKKIIPQFCKLASYYSKNPQLRPCQLFDKKIYLCASNNKEKKKWCGTGENTIFIDTDGKRYPCSFFTPMTFNDQQLSLLETIDFKNVDNFIDSNCYDNCYLYPICPSCAGANYLTSGTLDGRNKTKCIIFKLLSIFIADMHANRILSSREQYSNEIILHKTIDAIEHIKEEYLPEFQEMLSQC